MKFELTIGERLVALSLLPQKTNFLTHKAVESLRMKLGFSEEEIADREIKQTDDGRALWNPEKDVPVEIEMGGTAYEALSKSLKELDKKSELESHHVPLYEKLVGSDIAE